MKENTTETAFDMSKARLFIETLRKSFKDRNNCIRMYKFDGFIKPLELAVDAYEKGSFEESKALFYKAARESIAIAYYCSNDDSSIERLASFLEDLDIVCKCHDEFADVVSNINGLDMTLDMFLKLNAKHCCRLTKSEGESLDAYFVSLFKSACLVVVSMMLIYDPVPALDLFLDCKSEHNISFSEIMGYGVLGDSFLEDFKRTKIYQDENSYFNNSCFSKLYDPMDIKVIMNFGS